MAKGYLAIVLHAHLPFIRHPEFTDFLEEDWLFEAITETYIPLIKMLQGLERDKVEYKLTISLSPTLMAMLMDSHLQGKYIRHLEKLIELSEKEIDKRLSKLAEFEPKVKSGYLRRYAEKVSSASTGAVFSQ